MSSMSSDLSSQQIVINQMKNKIKNFESFLKIRENVFNILQSKFNELKLEHKSNELTLETSFESSPNRISMETLEVSASHNSDSEMKTREELRFKGKLLLLKRQLRHSLALIERQKGEKESIERVLQELKDKRIEKKVKNKVYAKNSFDRFGDDLTELILQYLTFEDKDNLELVSKQWRRLIYNKQFVIEIDFFNEEYIRQNSLNSITDICKSCLVQLDKQSLESVLKKCPNILKASFVDYYCVDSSVLSLIGRYCPRIKSLNFDSDPIKDCDFFRIYGHKLEELYIR